MRERERERKRERERGEDRKRDNSKEREREKEGGREREGGLRTWAASDVRAPAAFLRTRAAASESSTPGS